MKRHLSDEAAYAVWLAAGIAGWAVGAVVAFALIGCGP